MSRNLHLRWMLLAAFGLSCTAIDRGRSRLKVTADGSYSEAVDVYESGCDEEFHERREQRHRLVGGGVAVRHEGREGFVVGGRGRLVRGSLLEHRTEHSGGLRAIADRDGYSLLSVGALMGYDRLHAGLELGGSALGVPGEDAWGAFGYLRVKAGDLTVVWGELTLGSDDPLYAATFLSAGVAFRSTYVDGRLAATSHSRLLRDAFGRTPVLGGADDEDPGLDAGGLLELDVAVAGGWGIGAGTIVSASPLFRVGLSYTFERDEPPPRR